MQQLRADQSGGQSPQQGIVDVAGLQSATLGLTRCEPHADKQANGHEHPVPAYRDVAERGDHGIDVERDQSATFHVKLRSGTPARFLTTSVTVLALVVRAANWSLPSRW